MLSSTFFQEYTDAKRDKALKTYDHLAFGMDDYGPEEEPDGPWTEEWTEDDLITLLAQEHQDDDASLVLQFEEAIQETIQNDADLSAYFSTYEEARRRLSERFKTRGFWPMSKGKGKGFGGKKGASKGGFKGNSLA